MIRILFACLLTFSATFFSQSADAQTVAKGKDFYVLTIPKSGSFLIQKLLVLLTNKTYSNPSQTFYQMNAFRFHEDDPSVFIPQHQLEDYFLRLKGSNLFALAHFNFADSAAKFSESHPEYVKIIQLRDLRDVCVSWAHFMLDKIELEIGPNTFDDRLMYIITQGDKVSKEFLLPIYKNARKALEWINQDGVLITRFEDLVGKQGGGSVEAQENLIINTANALNISLTQEELHQIAIQLFGNHATIGTVTFREGKIGSWKNCFKEEHKRAFEEHLGELQVALGYSLDWE